LGRTERPHLWEKISARPQNGETALTCVKRTNRLRLWTGETKTYILGEKCPRSKTATGYRNQRPASGIRLLKMQTAALVILERFRVENCPEL